VKQITGIGGIFFKCKDPKAVNEWYKTHLGFAQAHMEQALNGETLMTARKRAL
jgi:hypothetical protein